MISGFFGRFAFASDRGDVVEVSERACRGDQGSIRAGRESLECGHVPEVQCAAQRRQNAPFLVDRGKPAPRPGQGGAAARAVPGRDQRQPARGVGADHRGVRRARAGDTQLALFPNDRTPPALGADAVQVRLDALRYHLDKARLRQVIPREGRYLLRTNLAADDPELIWRCSMQLCFVEEAFRTLKGDLGLRPIFHHQPRRIEAHLFIRVPRPLPGHHPAPATPRSGRRPDAPDGLRETRHRATARCRRADHRRPRDAPGPPHRTCARRAAAPRSTRPPLPAPTTSPHPHLPARVVATFYKLARCISHLHISTPPVAEVGLARLWFALKSRLLRQAPPSGLDPGRRPERPDPHQGLDGSSAVSKARVAVSRPSPGEWYENQNFSGGFAPKRGHRLKRRSAAAEGRSRHVT